jgi:hypothetical protein
MDFLDFLVWAGLLFWRFFFDFQNSISFVDLLFLVLVIVQLRYGRTWLGWSLIILLISLIDNI